MNELPFPSALFIIKAMIVSGLFVYTIFAFILTRQVDLERKTVVTDLGGLLELLALVHFIACLLLFLFAAFML